MIRDYRRSHPFIPFGLPQLDVSARRSDLCQMLITSETQQLQKSVLKDCRNALECAVGIRGTSIEKSHVLYFQVW